MVMEEESEMESGKCPTFYVFAYSFIILIVR